MRLGKLVPFVAFLAALILFAFAAPVTLARAQAENQPPEFPKFLNTRSVDENTAPGQPIEPPVAATDPDGDTLYYAIFNGDAAMFDIDSRTGQIRTKAPLDYEAMEEPQEYWFHVAVRDGKGPDGSTDLVADDSAHVTIEVKDADDPGTVTLDWQRPYVGTQLTAELEDQDGVESEGSWQWKRSNSRNGSYAPVSGATSKTYTPVSGDENKYLQVTVTYTNSGHDRTAAVVSAHPVRSVRGARSNATLAFSEGTSTTRSVQENTPAGTNVGASVRANQGGDLLYTLGGTDSSSFDIDRGTGQIKTKADLDFESKTSYTVTVTVAAPSGQPVTIDVTISVTDEPVEINGPSSAEHSENPADSSLTVAHYTIEPSEATLSVTGPDARHFSIGSYSGLTFKTQPDYDSPSDSGRNNVYEVTINAVDGNNRKKTKNVRVTVTDYNEAPVLTGPASATFTEERTGTVARYTAMDPENDPIRWRVQDTDDHEYFQISRSGVLTFRAPPDADTKSSYELVIIAESGMNQAADGKRIGVTLTDVDDPVFAGGNTHTRQIPENTASGEDIGDLLTATDNQGRSITYSLAGPDARSFAVNSSSGQLRTRASLDYEKRNSYTVWVRASNGRLAAHAIVTIEVTNVEEAGTLTLPSAQPRARVPFTATLSDLDGETWSESWQWKRSTTQDSGYTDIPGQIWQPTPPPTRT